MDTDTAYLLVELGVRHTKDLTKVDPSKAYDMMKCLSNSQPDFTLISINTLKNLIENAKNIPSKYPEYQDILSSKLTKSLEKVSIDFYELQKLLYSLSQINIADIVGEDYIESDDPPPTFLFRDNLSIESITDKANSMQVIQKGLGFLQDVELALPLPSTIRGTVYMVRSGENLPTSEEKRQDYAFYDALVEINGISSSSEDKAEDSSNPQGYTDSNGNFVIVMPDKYNMQEAIIVNISKNGNKQKIILSASDIINNVDKQSILKAFNELDLVYSDIEEEEKHLELVCSNIEEEQEKLDFISRIMNLKERTPTQNYDPTKDDDGQYGNYQEYYDQQNDNFQRISDEDFKRYNELFPKKESIEKKIDSLKKEKEKLEDNSEIPTLEAKKTELEKTIRLSDNSTNNLDRILRNLTLCENLVSDFRKKPFILNEDIFKGYRTDQKRALPSVKLMGNDNEAIYLPTDTAPSRVFNYSMLQRLVEPSISPYADPDNSNPRISLTEAVDVMDFKDTIKSSPEEWPQMSSLGIGYVLNMHQAWVPDGFALGNLLYSLILAPGEEQRLIVREKSESYTITDTAEGADSTAESYRTSQLDNTTAAYEYALNQMIEADSSSKYSTRSSSFGISAGASAYGATLGLSGGFSKSSGKASSSASQSNTHNEASNAAQNFQHEIKTASEKVSQAQRLSISMATSEQRDSVATRIIANHNHSHTMTIQYWEVMRRYRMETCVDGIDLVLFVPLKLINFSNSQDFTLHSSSFNIKMFNTRYNFILKHSDALNAALPNKYKTGLNLITKYAAYPNWKMENSLLSERKITLTFQGLFLPFDDINITMFLKNGKGRIAGDVTYPRTPLGKEKDFKTTSDLKEKIKTFRNKTSGLKTCTCIFTLPSNVTDDDLSSIKIEHSLDELNHVLYKDPDAEGIDGENTASHNYGKLMEHMWNLSKDKKDDDIDERKIAYFTKMLPEAWVSPNITLSPRELRSLGELKIFNNDIEGSNNEKLTGMLSSSTLSPSVSITISSSMPTLRYSQLQQMETTFQHIVSNTMKYSQVIWTALSSDERALMLEKYTIDMDYSSISVNDEQDDITLPLLNCINVKKLLGFYGNCMLFPFTYPQKLADKIGKTAGELQDSLYKYHTNHFRVPSTVISLPTDGMIGEAVLGETNVSEEIDLTRFWNWKDSPIDSMPIDSSYLDNKDYLAGKTTKDISPLNLQGALATTPVTAADLVSALVNKQTPTFQDITGLDQLKDILNTATDSTSKGRDQALTKSNDIAKLAMEYAYKNAELEERAKSSNSGKNITSDENKESKDIDTSDAVDSDNDISDDLDSDSKSELNFELLKEIMNKIFEIKKSGRNPLDYVEESTGNKMTKEELLTIADKFCSEHGISFDFKDSSTS